jgi:hypothetical protein
MRRMYFKGEVEYDIALGRHVAAEGYFIAIPQILIDNE